MCEKKDELTLANPTHRFWVQPTMVHTVYFSTASAGLIHKFSKLLARRVSIGSKMSTYLDAPCWNVVICGYKGGSEALGDNVPILGSHMTVRNVLVN